MPICSECGQEKFATSSDPRGAVPTCEECGERQADFLIDGQWICIPCCRPGSGIQRGVSFIGSLQRAERVPDPKSGQLPTLVHPEGPSRRDEASPTKSL
jgi:hypothetical protein